MRYGSLIAVFLAIVCAQESPQQRRIQEFWEARLAKFTPQNLVRVEREDASTVMRDEIGLAARLSPLMPRPVRASGRGAGIAQNFTITILETSDIKQYRSLNLRIVLTGGFKQAETAFAEYLAMITVDFNKGSLSGRPVGELCYSLANGPDAADVIFLRRNAIVQVGFRARELRKKLNRTRSMNDPQIKAAAEDLAVKIDDVLAGVRR